MKTNIKSLLLFLVFATGMSSEVYGQWQFLSNNHMKNTNTLNVGIGSTAPAYKLHVLGNRIRIQASIPSSSSKILDLRTDGNAVDVNATNGPLYLHSTTSNTILQASSGNVGINTTTANAPLQFSNAPAKRIIVMYEYGNNDYQFTGFGRHSSANIFQLQYNVATNYTNHIFYAGESTSSSKELLRIEGNGHVGIGNNPDQKLDVSGNIRCINFSTNSDLRLKDNVQSIAGALDQIMALRGTSYSLNVEGFSDRGFNDGRQFGFIAQEVKEVVPDLVFTDSQGFYAVNYQGVIPVLVEACKEQQSDIREKDKLLQELGSELNGLESILTQLEQAIGN